MYPDALKRRRTPVTHSVKSKKMKHLTIIFITTILILFSGIALSSESTDWPVIQEVEKIYELNASAKEINISFPIKDINGVTQYLFVCKGGATGYLDKLSDETGINYTGWLGCRLIEGNKEKEFSLLAEDGKSAPWHTRGQVFNLSELTGECGNYPEYGRTRHFRLRGFVLTLDFFDIHETDGKIDKLKLKVSLVKDPKAISEYAEPSAYLTPYKAGRSCSEILKAKNF